MIKLTKNAKPAILVSSSVNWTEALLAKLALGEKPTATEATRYRHPDVKQALMIETNGKCAYCESKVAHIHHGDVEHIYPKSLDPAKTFEWDNLTIACEVCNQFKSNRDPNLEYILDPYNTDPEMHLSFAGAIVYSITEDFGKNTNAILELNRAALCERRKEKLEKTLSIFENILNQNLSLPARKAIYDNLLANEASDKSEYSAMNKSAIINLQTKLGGVFNH